MIACAGQGGAVVLALWLARAEPALATGGPAAAACVCPCPPPSSPGAAGHAIESAPPRPEAFDFNRLGRQHYRARSWSEAVAAYRQALAADPKWRAPQLNLACAHAQAERFADAVKEARALAQAAYVPWGRAIEEAVDLAPLRIRPERHDLLSALAEAGRAWGAALPSSMLFVARTSAPVKLPTTGVLWLGLGQEIFAYLAGSGTWRQLTNEDGRVLAFVRSPDGRRLLYVRAGKLVRQPGRPDVLRGLSLRELELSSMTLGPVVSLSADVKRIELSSDARGFHLRSSPPDDGPATTWRLGGTALIPATQWPPEASAAAPRVRLDGLGVLPQRQATTIASDGCAYRARDRLDQGLPSVEILPTGKGRPLRLPVRLGAGLFGLPFPKR